MLENALVKMEGENQPLNFILMGNRKYIVWVGLTYIMMNLWNAAKIAKTG